MSLKYASKELSIDYDAIMNSIKLSLEPGVLKNKISLSQAEKRINSNDI